MYLKIIVFLVVFTHLYAADVNILKSEISDNISDFAYTLKAPTNNLLTLDVSLEQSYKKELEDSNSVDILLLIDNTGSMGDIIEMIKNQIDSISSFILLTYPNVNIAISSISEHSNQKTHDAYKMIQNFTDDPNLIKKNISYLEIDDVNNTDYEEAYLYGLSRSLELSWRKDSQKIVFFIGDAWGHSPDQGHDNKLDTADDLYEDAVLKTYKDKNIKICSYFKDEHEQTRRYFNNLSNITNGFSKTIKIDSTVKDDFQDILDDLVGIKYDVNSPFNSDSSLNQYDNHYILNFDLTNNRLMENHMIRVLFSNNGNKIGNITINLVYGKPWGIFILVGTLLFYIVAFLALKFIYQRTNTTTIIDFAYLKHYFVLALAFTFYTFILYVIWLVLNQANFPIIWSQLWW